jgi:PAS domain S-box-containing protein
MASGKMAIGKPIQGHFRKQAISAIALPLRDASGATAGMLIGAMMLSGPELFGQLEQTKIGKTGFFLVYSPTDRLIVSATDKSRILTPLPARGVNTVVDQRLDGGVETAMIGVNSLGVENLSVGRMLKTTGWQAIAGISIAEAFAPIEKLKQQIYFAALVISLALILVLHFVLVRLLAPLEEASSAMRLMTQNKKDFAALPIRRDDEIGQMVENFNSLVLERKRMESTAERERIRLKTILKTASDGIHILDRDGVLVEANETFLNMLGYDDSAIGKLGIMDWSQSSWADSKVRLDDLTSHQGRVVVFETRHRCRDGSVIEVEISAAGIEIDGKGYLYAASRDITQRKQAEEELRNSKNRYQGILQNMMDAYWRVDPSGRIVEANLAISKMHGYSIDELLQMSVSDFEVIESEEETRKHIETIKREGRDSFESKHRCKDGRIIDVEISVNVSLDDPGHVDAFHRDITQRKQSEAEIKRSNAELEQFSYSISHDMRQPLRMISSYLQLLEKSLAEQLDGEKREYFGFAIDGAKRMDAMMLGLLDYSRVGRKGEPAGWVESRALLDQALMFLKPAIIEAQADIHIQGDWPRVLVSPDEMLRLMQNLIGNALKFRVAGRKPEIIIASETADKEWRLCIADNGVGILPDQIDRLFQVFQRLQSRAAYEGTGIGLALCRKIAEHQHGRIWAESAGDGQGSRFYVGLPLDRSEHLG